MKKIFIVVLLACPCLAQSWSGILDPSRAIPWQGNAGFAIPSYSTPCGATVSLTAGALAAASNTIAITAAIAGCLPGQNVVNLPAGTYYIHGWTYGLQNNVALRGAGPNSTYLFDSGPVSCYGYATAGFCMGGNSLYAQSNTITPGTGAPQTCSFTGTNGTPGTYTQGATSIILNSCGSAPPVGLIVMLDQADDGTDNGGIWLCSGYDVPANGGPTPQCQQNSPQNNADGRLTAGLNPIQYSEQQAAVITSVSGSGAGPYTVTISQGLYFNNFRTARTPGAWWASSNATHLGLENLTIDHSADTSTNAGGIMIWCNQCWYKNVRSLNALENSIFAVTDYEPVIRDSYFYGSQHGGAESYAVQMEEVSGGLVENNILQNTTSPDIKDAVTGSVTGYNFTPYINFGTYLQGLYASHNSGSAFNLEEGNSTTEFLADDVWGTSDLITIFRNQATGWQPGYTQQTFPISANSGVRALNIVGNVLGQPGYHTQYEAYATSTTAGVHTFTAGGSTTAGSGTVNQSIYELGWTDTAGLGVCTQPPLCDALTYSTLFRWGNYDTVQAAVTWNNAESSPGAVPFVNASTTPASHTLPSSFYLTARPSWFRSVPFPAIGPDVSGGTTGICSGGTYAGLQATSGGQCTGGSLTASAWGGHANVNPAEDCYLNVMNGPPDGSGGALAFDAATCYATTPPATAATGIAIMQLHP